MTGFSSIQHLICLHSQSLGVGIIIWYLGQLLKYIVILYSLVSLSSVLDLYFEQSPQKSQSILYYAYITHTLYILMPYVLLLSQVAQIALKIWGQ